jgi:flavin reductase (DIM6/NTAB) family NADH-FMN oxidoreductase RutF/polyisoprenoid-binding protein YceI
MMHLRTCKQASHLAALILVAAGLSVATAPLVAQRAIPNGTIESGVLSFDGRATVGDFTGTTSTITGTMVGAAELSAVRGWVEAPVSTLVTGNAKRDKDLNKSMESGKYPVIRFDLTQVVPGAVRGDTVDVTMQGTFHIHGVSQEAAIPATVVLLPDAVQVRGETALNLKSYKIGGLSKALGMLRMQEEIIVHLDLTFTMARQPGSDSVSAHQFDRKKRSAAVLRARYRGPRRHGGRCQAIGNSSSTCSGGPVHSTIDPAILYFGTPVVLVSSLNPDGSPNLAPMSSAWWLGRSCLLGFGARSHTPANIQRTGECVLNLPSAAQVAAVNRLARTTGSSPVPPHKVAMGYRHEADKFRVAGLTPLPAELVAPPRVEECPVHLEATLEASHPLAQRDAERRGHLIALEVRVVRVHVDDSIRMAGHADRIDPERWRPLIMNFCEFFGLGSMLHPSTLAEIPESAYRPRRRAPEEVARESAA